MRRVKAFKDGKLVSLLRAEAVTEETRRAFEYQCIEAGCDCGHHWRKAVYAKGNTEPRPPTFVKNKSSSHKDACPGDLDRIMHENVEYTTIKNGQIHVRINFPLGAAPVDRYPLRGYLSAQHLKAAEGQKTTKPYSHIKDLVKFIEKNFTSLDSESAAEIIVDYQGQSAEWGKLFKGSDAYDRLYRRATNYRPDDGRETPPVITIVRPVRELEPNKSGKRRFQCAEQIVKIDGRKQKIVPVIVCDTTDRAVEHKVAWHMKEGSTMIVSARPFNPGQNSAPARFGEQRISLFVFKMEQLEPVAASYWKPPHNPGQQLDLFTPGNPAP